MKNKWQKLGRLYHLPDAKPHPKLVSHVANPLPVLIKGDIYRIFFSARDSNKRSSIGAVDIDIIKRKIIKEHSQPFFEFGPKNSFYSQGISIGNYYKIDDITYMLFMGWSNSESGHWQGEIGRLILTADLSLKLDSKTPLISFDEIDPISLSYPWVNTNEDGSFMMWYGSTKTWDSGNGEMLHVINYATSKDGQTWERKGLAIPYELDIAQAFSRPTIIKNNSTGYKMWFSYRGNNLQGYRIGYAESNNGKDWQLDLENSGINVSRQGWDSEMIEYPYVFDHKDQRYMLYNGNDYGKSGFGLARLEIK